MADNVSLGSAIGFQAKPIDRTVTVLNELDKQRKEDENIFKAAQANLRANQQRIDKHKADIDKFVISTDKGIPLVDQPDMKARAAELYNMVQDEINNDRDPGNSLEIRNKQYEMKQAADKSQQSLKRFTADLAIANNPSYQGKVEFNPEYLKAYQTGDHDSWTKLTGTDYYAGGALKLKAPLKDWRKSAYQRTQRVGTIIASNGQKEVPQQAKDADFKDFTSTQDYEDAILEQQVDGVSPEQAARNVKDTYYRYYDFKAAPDVSTGSGTGKKAKYEVSGEAPSEKQTVGFGIAKGNEVVIAKKGGGALPADNYRLSNGKTIYGRPTGSVFKKNDSGEMYLEVSVPDKSLQYPADWKDKTDEEKEKWLAVEYDKDPNKFKIENVPLKSDFNKNKVETSFGKPVDDLFKKTEAKKATTTPPKTVSSSKIKSLVGTKGYEGYSEKELIDYYKSQGYNIK